MISVYNRRLAFLKANCPSALCGDYEALLILKGKLGRFDNDELLEYLKVKGAQSRGEGGEGVQWRDDVRPEPAAVGGGVPGAPVPQGLAAELLPLLRRQGGVAHLRARAAAERRAADTDGADARRDGGPAPPDAPGDPGHEQEEVQRGGGGAPCRWS